MKTEEHIPGIKVPTKELLSKYYAEWLMGKDDVQIAESLGVDVADIQRYASSFMNYCRYAVQFESKEILLKYNHALEIPLTPERRKKFIDLVKHGVSIAKASRILNVPVITIYDYWYVIDPMLRVEIETAVDELDAKVIKSLAKRAVGYKVKNKTTTTTSGTSERGPISMTVVSEVERDVPADVNAAKFWLINRSPDKFTLDGNANKSENKGRILEYIDGEIEKEADKGYIAIEDKQPDDESDIY